MSHNAAACQFLATCGGEWWISEEISIISGVPAGRNIGRLEVESKAKRGVGTGGHGQRFEATLQGKYDQEWVFFEIV